jgi:hypothetical protein
VRRLVLLGLVATGVLAAAAHAYFSTTKPIAQTVSSVADFLPPVASAAQIVGSGNTVGNISPGQRYQVYAQVADQGNPPSGVQSVTADVSSLSGSGASATLTAGSYTIGAATYNYRSPDQTASRNLGSGPKPYSLTMTDALSQASTQSFTVSSGPQCAPESFATSNGQHSQKKKVDSEDEVVYDFTTPIDTRSIISYWTGGGVGVTILLTDRGSNDELSIVNQSTGQATPLGTVLMKGDFAHGDVRFGGVIQLEGSDKAVVRIGGLYGGTGQSLTVNDKTAMTWTPAPGITDVNGSPCATTSVTQPKPVHNF